MLIGTLDEVEFAPEYPELAGKRVLVTGVAGPLGVEIVRAFADAQTRLVVQTSEDSPEMQALAEIIAPTALDVRFFPGPLAGADAMLRFAREAAQKFGGLDCVVNLAVVPEPPEGASEEDIEALVTDVLAMPVLATRVAANRMRTMLSPGALLNVLTVPRNAAAGRTLLAAITRNALAGFTRTEAEAAAAEGIRVNAIVPASSSSGSPPSLAGNVDVATLALHLASGRDHNLSGIVFEAWCG
ncbi:MAG: SDR family NAD(P)-dependent oxidoreductase [Hyphomicrobiaceae bacterium]|nr:SDR family NAD(P)-dependent oxidoreductase [Hyphomicrobiaceae bacterium]